MSDFQNEEGEYLMTAAELRLEAEIDFQSAEVRAEEAWYERDDLDFVGEGVLYCDTCDEGDHYTEDCKWQPEEDTEE